jgi:hypothetical protein
MLHNKFRLLTLDEIEKLLLFLLFLLILVVAINIELLKDNH